MAKAEATRYTTTCYFTWDISLDWKRYFSTGYRTFIIYSSRKYSYRNSAKRRDHSESNAKVLANNARATLNSVKQNLSESKNGAEYVPVQGIGRSWLRFLSGILYGAFGVSYDPSVLGLTKSTFTKQELETAYRTKLARARSLYARDLQSLEKQYQAARKLEQKTEARNLLFKKFLKQKLTLLSTLNNQTRSLGQTYDAILGDIALWLPYTPKS